MELVRLLDAHAMYFNTCRGWQPPTTTLYVPVWHQNIEDFIQCRNPDIPASSRVHHIATAVLLPDIL